MCDCPVSFAGGALLDHQRLHLLLSLIGGLSSSCLPVNRWQQPMDCGQPVKSQHASLATSAGISDVPVHRLHC
eukprot:15444722-Alexandrium_andersonii.AAC.2